MSKEQARPAKARKPAPQPFHYTASGLDDVWLLNGFRIERTPYGDGVVIEDADGLHAALAHSIAIARAPMRPAEFRFLRKHLGFSQEAMARLLGCSAQSVARWEKGQVPVDATAERLVRLVIMDTLGEEWAMLEALAELAELDARNHAERRLRRRAGAWREAA